MTLSQAINKSDFAALWSVTLKPTLTVDLSEYANMWWDMNQNEEVINNGVAAKFKRYIYPKLYEVVWWRNNMVSKITEDPQNTKQTRMDINSTTQATNESGMGYQGYSLTNQNNQFQKNTNKDNATNTQAQTIQDTSKLVVDKIAWMHQEMDEKISGVYKLCSEHLLVNIW